MLSFGYIGRDPNRAEWVIFDSILRVWESKDSPCLGCDVDKILCAQSTCVLPIEGMRDQFTTTFNRRNKTDLIDSRYAWLPAEFDRDGPLIRWVDQRSTQTMEAVCQPNGRV